MTSLFDPITVGTLSLPNRIFMSPLTRLRAPGNVPNSLMAEHYRLRASAGLIISEGIPIMPEAVGYPHVPGIWNESQVAGWRGVTNAVHEAGGRIFAQLWHVGRVSNPSLAGAVPVAPSAIAAAGHIHHTRPKTPYVEPHALTEPEVQQRVEAFRLAAIKAQQAGFDGVTIHGANGYLLDQFLQDGSNKRTDKYGGTIENRARFMLEVVDAVISVWGAGRVSINLAPRSPSHDINDSDPARTFTYVARELGKRHLAFLYIRETSGPDALLPSIKQAFGGVCVANDGFDIDMAKQAVATGAADAVGFGRLYIANPDLVERIRVGATLNTINSGTIYDIEHPSSIGYNDYPRMNEKRFAGVVGPL
jgi:2,4-dienoyl-CoA reductase-like NADH-dependent reductase (Old Yellow Enzyme family)